MLAFLHERSGGRTREVNRKLIVANARLAGEVAVAFAAPVSLYDAVRDLPLEIEGYALEGARAAGPRGLPAQDDRRPPARRRRGGDRRGRHLRRPPSTSGCRSAGPDLPLAGAWTLHSFSEHSRRAAALPRGAGPARVPRLPPLGVRERRARPRAPPGGALARRRGRSRGPAGHLRRLDGPRLPAVHRARQGVARALPRPPLQARRDARVDATSSSRSSRRPAPSTRSTSRATTAAPSSTRPPTPRSTAAWPRACPSAWLEDPALTDETTPVLEPHRDRSPGTRSSTPSRTSRRSPGRRRP